MNNHSTPERRLLYIYEDELERLAAIENAALKVWEAVAATHDHSQWLEPLGKLATALKRRL